MRPTGATTLGRITCGTLAAAPCGPSETLAMRWEDVNWAEDRVLVHSIKTERYEGKGTRVIPMFPELKKELERQFDEAAEGSVFVIDRWRNTEKNMRTHFQRIIFR